MLERLYFTCAMGPNAKRAKFFSSVADVVSYYAASPASQRPCSVAITIFMGVVAGLLIFFPALFLYPCLIHVPPTP